MQKNKYKKNYEWEYNTILEIWLHIFKTNYNDGSVIII